MGACCVSGTPLSNSSHTDAHAKRSPIAKRVRYEKTGRCHPCQALSKNAKLRKRSEFRKECCSRLQKSAKNHGNKKVNDFFSTIVDEFMDSQKDEKEDEDSDDEDEDWSLESFWKDLTTLDDKLVSLFDNKMLNLSDQFLASFIEVLLKSVVQLQDGLVTADHLYQVIRDLPVLEDILPADTKYNDTTPPHDKSFYNWALTVTSNPKKIVYLRTKNDIVNLIAEARKDGLKVRVMNYSHSFSPMFGDDGSLMGKLLPDEFISLNPAHIPLEFDKSLTKVWVKDRPLMYCTLDLKRNTITVGGATPNSMYTDLVERRVQEGMYEFPAEIANVIQIYASWVGTAAVGCHGAGIDTTNISTYCIRLNMVNWEGKEVVYDTPAMIKAMGAHFGLLGVVTEMELQFAPAYFCLYKPYFCPLEEYLADDLEKFQEDLSECYYNELFWFPLHDDIYVNNFKITDDPKGVELHPGTNVKRSVDKLLHSLLQLILMAVPRYKATGWEGRALVQIAATITEQVLDQPKRVFKIPSCNGLHYRYGIQNMRVLNMEWALPLHSLKDGNGQNVLNKNGHTVPDARIARDLFHEAIKTLMEWHERDVYPQTLPLEMRIIRGCDQSMVFGKDCEFVCTIEVLSNVSDDDVNEVFYTFCQEIADRWLAIIKKNRASDLKLCRPHWGKWWQGLKVEGRDIYEHLKWSYADSIKGFNAIRREADPNDMFLNKSFQKIFSA